MKRTSCASKWTLLAVAEAEIDRGSAACGAGHERLELAPGTEDLVDAVFSCRSSWVAVDSHASLQIIGGPIELTAVFEDRGKRVESELSLPGLGVVGDRLVDLDRVEFVGKLEPLDSGSQPGDGLVVFQGVEGIRAGRFGRAFFGWDWHVMADHGLGAELAVQESGQGDAGDVQQLGWVSDGLGERPAPALAVVPGSCEAFRANGSRRVSRRARRVAGPAVPVNSTADSRRSRAAHRAP